MLKLAEEEGAINSLTHRVSGLKEERDLLIINLSNERFDPLMAKIQERFEDVQVNFYPNGIIALRPPAGEAPEEVTEVNSRSPFEVFLSGLQSVGSWKGFIGYSVCSGIVAWIGLFTDNVYLLIGAMLISPIAGPAMTLALGTARGDLRLIRQSFIRYFISLFFVAATAAGLSYLIGLKEATNLMVMISQVSSVAGLLAVTAGAAGAVTLCQSDRDSLVTAAGPGMLVAASLAPPTAIVGMAMVLGQFQMAKSGAYLLLLQLFGINIAAALVFWVFGLAPKGTRYKRGEPLVKWSALGGTVLALAALFLWQYNTQPNIQRSTLSKRYRTDVQRLIKESGLAEPVKISASFTRSNIEGQNTLLVEAFVQKKGERSASEIEAELTSRIKEQLNKKGEDITPLVDISVLTP